LGDTHVADGERARFTKAVLPNGATSIPSLCIHCGTATSRTTRFHQKAKNERYGTNPDGGGGAVGLLMTWLFDYLSGKMHQEINIDVPHCGDCHFRDPDLRVTHLDFDRRVATFIVHREFRDALERARQKENPTKP
jgi:hypothetical protein